MGQGEVGSGESVGELPELFPGGAGVPPEDGTTFLQVSCELVSAWAGVGQARW